MSEEHSGRSAISSSSSVSGFAGLVNEALFLGFVACFRLMTAFQDSKTLSS